MCRNPSIFISLMLLTLIFISGCGGDRGASERMDRADSIIETAPDSAMAILDSIAPGSLMSKQEKARYALLRSMALDKNYIDTISFEVIQPAIDYYLKKGTPDEKLRTLYYQGRIYQNRHEDEEALKCYIKATELKDEITDSIVLARTYTAKGYLYYNQNRFYLTTTYSLSAAEICKKIGRTDLEADNLTQAFDAFINIQDRYHADSVFKILESMPEDYKQWELNTHCRIIYATNFLPQKKLLEILNSINKNELNNSLLLDMALGYVKAGDKLNSFECFNNADEPYTEDRVKYLYIKSKVQEVNEDYEGALSSLRDGIEASDSILTEWTKDDRMFAGKKYELEKKLSKEKEENNKTYLSLIIIILALVIILLLLYLYFSKTKIKALKSDKEKFQYKMGTLLLDKKYTDIQDQLRSMNSDLNQVKSEKRTITSLNDQIKAENNKMSDDIKIFRQALSKYEEENKRLVEMVKKEKSNSIELRNLLLEKNILINGLVASHIASNDKHSSVFNDFLKKVDNDKEFFLSSMHKIFIALYPNFMNKLKDLQFTEVETDYVCLYAIGLRGKEIGNYLQTKSHYNISSSIRSKLGLDKKETNLSLFIINEIKKEVE